MANKVFNSEFSYKKDNIECFSTTFRVENYMKTVEKERILCCKFWSWITCKENLNRSLVCGF